VVAPIARLMTLLDEKRVAGLLLWYGIQRHGEGLTVVA